MQGITTIARPYARAVFEQASADGELQAWSDMLQLLKLVASDRAMLAIIKNPKVTSAQLIDIVVSIGGGLLNEKGRNFVKLLVDAGRLSLAPEISRLFEQRKAAAESITGVEVISAYPLEDAQREMIRKIMTERLHTKIEITSRTDESLIGGVVIRAGDSVIDVSLRGRLKQLSHNFAE